MSVRLCIAALLAAATAGAQQTVAVANDPAIGGIVRDSAGKPIPEAEVAIIRNGRMLQFIVTGSDGKFLLTGVSAGVLPLRVRRVGYTMQSFDVDARLSASKSLEIVLVPVASELPEVTVEAGRGELHGFYQRREQRAGFAKFLEQSDVRRAGVTRSSELFRSVPGVVLRTGPGVNQLRVRDCQPMLWIDGQRVPGAELDEVIQPPDIAAIEFYPSSAGIPAEYTERGNRLCGAIIVWSRTQ
ncbi:MAG TPA: carboxypeptidase-like regulatory domain-containing protein [Gemmatimonadaceae bacterium]|nr:carboxypeptidase-like regulatory domain-containing protein [Gemmatimonadaceae bacterium]